MCPLFRIDRTKGNPDGAQTVAVAVVHLHRIALLLFSLILLWCIAFLQLVRKMRNYTDEEAWANVKPPACIGCFDKQGPCES